MNGFDYFKKALNQYTDIKGRARRSEYWYFTLFNFLGAMALAALVAVSEMFSFLYLIWALGLIVPGFCVAVRRMHDLGKSGTYLLIALIPFIGGIILLVWMVGDSQPGSNKWGPNPKEVSDEYNVSEHLV